MAGQVPHTKLAALLMCATMLTGLGSASRALAQGYSPDVAASKMTVAPGFAVDLVAAEPHVRQPVCIEFDDRGRLWAVQYLQYPNPAGLKRVKVDRYSRTVYDRVPEPPPRGPKGADLITILEDTDGDGRVDHSKDFVSGLNLTTGIAFGYDGVFVLNVPYLLFYADRNHDDVPDGDPEVLLSGFGMEDTSSLANSLAWGPDGWLYGTQGTNITAHIRGIDFEQGVWRYHPVTREFELFCEGGGNSWGLDFDDAGTLFYSTNYGGFVMVHGFQGAYYVKQFQKHGALHNPFAFGYFDHVPHKNFVGGHVTVGGLVYQETLFPPQFRGKYIGADLLGHSVYWHNITRNGSTVRTAHGGKLLSANDSWFAPSDVAVGPDGAIYVADWHDKRTAHPDPDADWDRTNGRVYRLRPAGAPLRKDLPGGSLVDRLFLPDTWHARRALRQLAEHPDPRIAAVLTKRIHATTDPTIALRALWGIYASGGFDETLAAELLGHPAEAVRVWTIRFLGDQRNVSSMIETRLQQIGAADRSPDVLAQLACSARRLPALCALRILARVAENPVSQKDPCIPLLVWWGVETHAIAGRELALATFASRHSWNVPLIRDVIVGRLIKRYAAEGTPEGFRAVAKIFASAETPEEKRQLMPELDEGLTLIGNERADGLPLGFSYTQYAVVQSDQRRLPRRLSTPPTELRPVLSAIWGEHTTDPLALRLACRLGSHDADRRVLQLAADEKLPAKTRGELLHLLGDLGTEACVPTVLTILHASHDTALRTAALSALGHFDDPQIAAAVLSDYGAMNPGLRSAARNLLFSRRDWSRTTLSAVDRNAFPATDVESDDLRRIALYHDAELDATVLKRWGNIRAGTPEEKLADIRRLSNDLRAAAGRPEAGHALYTKHCATCHSLFGEGNKIGPDLTTANRKDRDFLLVSMVDPGVQIRKEYLAYVVETNSGRVFTGLIAEQNPSSITLVGAKNERTTIPRNDIEEIKVSPTSLMPERLLEPLKPQEVRDLFSYLQK